MNEIKGVKAVYIPVTADEQKQIQKNIEYVLSKIASRLTGKKVKVTISKKEEHNDIQKAI